MPCLFVRRWRPVHAITALVLLASLAALLATSAPRQDDRVPDIDPDRRLVERDLKPLAWRSVGPANMGGRVAALALAPSDDKSIYIGYGTGGIWHSDNRGTTFKPIFDDYETSSIGDLVVCDVPEDWAGWNAEESRLSEEQRNDLSDRRERGKAKIIWVGTGESNGRNSSSWGHGMYRSTDGGESFTHLGLEDSHDIPQIAVHPTNPDICYVAAQGHLWGENETRGVYKTTDGGASWERILYINERTGACAIMLDPENPNIVYAAMYTRLRTPYSFQSGSTDGGMFRSNDAGANWTKLTNGLPNQTGRIGMDIAMSQPNTIYLTLQSNEGGKVGEWFDNRSRAGGVFRSDDRGDTWERVSDFNPRPFYFSKIRVDPKDPDRVYLLGWQVSVSDDGGRTFVNGSAKVVHVDFHDMIINPNDTDNLLVGNDGGLYISNDRAKTWDFQNHMAVGQFYNVAVDDSDPYRIGGGLQDNGSWIGTSESMYESKGDFMGRKGAIRNRNWQFIYGGDGFHVIFDPVDENIVYAEWQGGNIARIHLDTGIQRNIKPIADEGEVKFRYNWNAPILVSPHDPTVVYLAGNCVFRLDDRGDRWTRISDDLSTRAIQKIMTEGSQAESHGTVVALTESSLVQGLLWAGTDDGLIHITADGGATWEDITPDLVASRYISKIEASVHDPFTAYVAVDGHRTDDFEPVILKTSDAGETWSTVANGIPNGAPVKVVREDPSNPMVLYAGTERAAYVTINGGASWLRLNGKELPTVAIDDLAIQAREHDIVAGTHGRSVWVLDDASAIAQLNDEIVTKIFHVFNPLPGQPKYRMGAGAMWSDAMFVAENPPVGANLHYWIREYTDEDVKISITDAQNRPVRKMKGTNRPGMNRVVWDLQADKTKQIGNPDDLPEFVAPGTYTVNIMFGDRKQSTTIEVLPAPE
ncbi:MAG: hypothetical protein AAF432_04320 [Planctomycetota bacterium]